MTVPTLERYERVSAIPMLILSVGFILLWIAPVALELPAAARSAMDIAGWTVWLLFAADYAIRFRLAPDKGAFVKRNVVDLLIVILPLLAPLRVFSGLRALRVLRALTLVSVAVRAQKRSRSVLNTEHIAIAVVLIVTLAVIGATLELQFEASAPRSNIKSFGDSIWWAITTITTVGYGDKYPTTVEGKGIALLLMLAGVGATGLLSAGLAAYFIGGQQEHDFVDIVKRLDRIEARLIAAGRSSNEHDSEAVTKANAADATAPVNP